MMTYLLEYYIDCTGCGRTRVIYLKSFPDDYPKDKMLCCVCTASYYTQLGIQKPSNILGYSEFFNKIWWDSYGKGIEKAMRLQ